MFPVDARRCRPGRGRRLGRAAAGRGWDGHPLNSPRPRLDPVVGVEPAAFRELDSWRREAAVVLEDCIVSVCAGFGVAVKLDDANRNRSFHALAASRGGLGDRVVHVIPERSGARSTGAAHFCGGRARGRDASAALGRCVPRPVARPSIRGEAGRWGAAHLGAAAAALRGACAQQERRALIRPVAPAVVRAERRVEPSSHGKMHPERPRSVRA